MKALINKFRKFPTLLNAIEIDNNSDNLDPIDYVSVEIGIVRNITIEPILPFIKARLIEAGFNPTFKLTGVGSYLFDCNGGQSSDFWKDSNFASVFVFLWPEVISDIYNLSNGEVVEKSEYLTSVDTAETVVHQVVNAVINNTRAPIFISNAACLHNGINGKNFYLKNYGKAPIVNFNQLVENFVSSSKQINLFDLESIFYRIGTINSFEHKTFKDKLLPFSRLVFDEIAQEFAVNFTVSQNGPKKCIVVDCDNTLWYGIVGELGVDGIELSNGSNGHKHLALQKTLKHLKSLGFLLAISSKNNEKDVFEVFEKRDDMLLKRDEFVAHRINWEPKYINIQSIASELGLGLSSFVFIDDSDFECGMVQEHLPQVSVIQFNYQEDNPLIPLYAGRMFRKSSLTNEDFNKTEMYAAKAKFEMLVKDSVTSSEFLASMGITLTIGPPNADEIPRVSQLTQKTNQFNLTTKRYTEEQIQLFCNDLDYVVYKVRCADKFMDHGLIGVCILNQKTTEIDTLLLSCRVLGRGVEVALLAYLTSAYDKLVGVYKESAKNSMVRTLFRDNGFQELKSVVQDEDRWSWDQQSTAPLNFPKWITLIKE